jgi:predicted porin
MRGNKMRALLLLLISGAAALAQQSSIEVRSPSAKLLDTAPGRIITASVVVANSGSVTDEITERLTLPPGCQKIAPPDLPFRVEAGGQIVRVLAVLVPANMPAGRFELHYAAQSRRDPSLSGSVDLAIQVTPVDNLELVVEPRPDMVFAGDAYPVKLRVTNRGNSRISVQLTSRSSLGFAVSADAEAFTLVAGATREILCCVKVDAAFAQHIRHAVTFDVTATSPSGKTLTASQASVVEIIPRISGSRDPFHYLPMQLKLMTLAEAGHGAQFQAELSGAGSLDEAGKHRIDFLFRGPDVQNASLFGERDEYGASYHGEHWDVDLGDRIYSLSPLTEKHSLGRGAGVKWHDATTAAGVFYMTSRFRQHDTEELGAFIRQEITPDFSLQGNFLRKTGGDSLSATLLPQNIYSVESHYRRGKVLDLHLEAGVGNSDSGISDYAYRADARGELPGKLSYAIEHVHAGPNFLGYYSGTDTTYASLAKVIAPSLRVHASLSHYSDNPALNDVRSTVVNREDSWNAGADYELNKKTGLSVEWQHVNRTDILEPAAYDFTSDAVRFGINHDFGPLKLQSFLDIGTLDNTLTGDSGAFQRYSVNATWHPTARQSYTVFGSYGPSAFSGSSDKALGMGVSARWQLRDRLDANVSYARNQFDGLTGNQQDQALASIRYEFKDRRSFSLLGRWSHVVSKSAGSDATDEAAILATYSIPFNQPVSRKRSIGVLQGRLGDPSKGLPRVVLQIGEQFAVTDNDGQFEFPGLKPGACELKVVTDSLGPRLAMATPLPMKVRIRPAETTHVELTATPACALSVCVTRYEFAAGNSLTASGALRAAGGEEGVAVELANGRDVWRAQTDRTGTASFDRLPGGPWTLRVASGALPAFHTLENAAQTLTLRPGESRQIALRVLPQRRTLRLLDHGTIR